MGTFFVAKPSAYYVHRDRDNKKEYFARTLAVDVLPAVVTTMSRLPLLLSLSLVLALATSVTGSGDGCLLYDTDFAVGAYP